MNDYKLPPNFGPMSDSEAMVYLNLIRDGASPGEALDEVVRRRGLTPVVKSLSPIEAITEAVGDWEVEVVEEDVGYYLIRLYKEV